MLRASRVPHREGSDSPRPRQLRPFVSPLMRQSQKWRTGSVSSPPGIRALQQEETMTTLLPVPLVALATGDEFGTCVYRHMLILTATPLLSPPLEAPIARNLERPVRTVSLVVLAPAEAGGHDDAPPADLTKAPAKGRSSDSRRPRPPARPNSCRRTPGRAHRRSWR